MRRAIQVTLVVAMVAAACSDDGGAATTAATISTTTSSPTTSSSSTITTTTTTMLGPACPAPMTVATTADLAATLDGIEWQSAGPYAFGNLPVTPDLIIEGTISLSGGDIPPPDWCEGDCDDMAITWSGSIAGLTVEGEIGSPGAVVTLTDTTIRLRPFVRDYHPLPITWGPTVSVLPPCGTPCAEGLEMCPLDGSCYSAEAFCTRCEQRTVAECACRTLEGPNPDGGLCQVYISNDQIVIGVCRAGVCESG